LAKPDYTNPFRSNDLYKYLRHGDIPTHTVCAGGIEEHKYTGRDGKWLCGDPTTDTKRIAKQQGYGARHVNDISPKNVTHVNRIAVSMLHIFAPR